MEINEIILNVSEWAGVIAVTLLLTMNRHFAARPVAFKYQRREVILSTILAIVLIAAAVTANLALRLPTLPSDARPLPGQFLWAVLILLPVALLLVIRRQPLLSVGLSRPSTRLGLILGVALVLITIFLRGKIYSLLDGISAGEFDALILSLVLALVGEIIFRGFLQLRFTGWIGPTGGWLLASLAYFLFCLPFIWLVNGGDITAVWLPASVQLVQSILLGWIMHRSGNVLASGLYQAAHFWVSAL
jgi:membrane protease YdiL (CAAX protease family)